MVITGTEINYFFHCKRQLYLFHHKLFQEQTSELVKLGKLQHEAIFLNDNSEIALEGIKVDKIEGDFVIEHKRSKADSKAGEWQLLYYLYRLEQVGIFKKGKLTVGAKQEIVKTVELTDRNRKKLKEHLSEIENIVISSEIPKVINLPKCKKCAYFEYCFV